MSASGRALEAAGAVGNGVAAAQEALGKLELVTLGFNPERVVDDLWAASAAINDAICAAERYIAITRAAQ